jgi:hypothetical protein
MPWVLQHCHLYRELSNATVSKYKYLAGYATLLHVTEHYICIYLLSWKLVVYICLFTYIFIQT